MHLRRRSILQVSVVLAAGLAATQLRPRSASARTTTIERDVCVIGGGSSGTFSAVQLRDAVRACW